MKKLLISAMALALTTGASAAGTAQTDGKVKFVVNIPKILVLYHWDTAKLSLKGDSLVESDNAETNNTHTKADVLLSSTTAVINENQLAAGAGKLAGEMKVTLQNSWAVRSIADTDPKLAITNFDDTDFNSNGDSKLYPNGSGNDVDGYITVKEVKLQYNSTEKTEQTISKGWTPQLGNITFKLDLSKIKKSGDHYTKAAGGDTFKLALTAN